MTLPETVKSKTAMMFEFLGLQRSTTGLLAMVVLVGMGERMAERFLPVYILALGGSVMAIGLLQALDNLLSALYSFLGGFMSDRIGFKRSLLIFNLLAMIGFFIVIIFPFWQAVLAGAILFISWSAISLPAIMGLIYTVLPVTKHTMGVSVHSMVRRIPMAIGPVVGGLFIAEWGEETGVRMAFGMAFILALAGLGLLHKMIPDDKHRTASRPDIAGPALENNPFKLIRFMDPNMKRLLISDILIRFCEQIPYAFVVIWSMKVIAEPVSAIQFGILTSIEMGVAMLVYIPVAWFADNTTKKPFVLTTFAFFTLFPLVLFHSTSFVWLIPAFILRGLKEFGEPTRKSLIMDLSPENCRAGMFGLYYLIRDFFVTFAALGGALLWKISPQANLLTAFLFGVAGTIGFAVFGRDSSAL